MQLRPLGTDDGPYFETQGGVGRRQTSAYVPDADQTGINTGLLCTLIYTRLFHDHFLSSRLRTATNSMGRLAEMQRKLLEVRDCRISSCARH